MVMPGLSHIMVAQQEQQELGSPAIHVEGNKLLIQLLMKIHGSWMENHRPMMSN